METTVRRPDRPQHYMVIRPIDKLVRIRLPSGLELGKSKHAVRLLEVGNTHYDPVIYLPRQDIKVDLLPEADETMCPLKGTANYFGVQDMQVRHDKIAWTYLQTHDFANNIKDLIAFYPDKVVIEERPH